jgi:hypothetical protein
VTIWDADSLSFGKLEATCKSPRAVRGLSIWGSRAMGGLATDLEASSPDGADDHQDG